MALWDFVDAIVWEAVYWTAQAGESHVRTECIAALYGPGAFEILDLVDFHKDF